MRRKCQIVCQQEHTKKKGKYHTTPHLTTTGEKEERGGGTKAGKKGRAL